jgi:hypothetical protein
MAYGSTSSNTQSLMSKVQYMAAAAKMISLKFVSSVRLSGTSITVPRAALIVVVWNG